MSNDDPLAGYNELVEPLWELDQARREAATALEERLDAALQAKLEMARSALQIDCPGLHEPARALIAAHEAMQVWRGEFANGLSEQIGSFRPYPHLEEWAWLYGRVSDGERHATALHRDLIRKGTDFLQAVRACRDQIRDGT